jgi:hypothetical protein
MGPNEYAQVNVYRSKGRWTLAAMVKRAGRPHSRLVGPIRYFDLAPESAHVGTALRLAAERLIETAAALDDPPQRRSRSGAP